MDKETIKLAEEIEGMLYPSEPSTLYELGKKCKGGGVIVEIGSWKGRSTMLLARGSLHSSQIKVYAVDTFKETIANGTTPVDVYTEKGKLFYVNKDKRQNTFLDFKNNIKKAEVDGLVIPLIGKSTKVAETFDKLIELLFIDGSHDYKSVISDINSWEPKIIENGWIAFHDTTFPDVMKAFKEKIFSSKNYSNIGFCGSIIYAQKARASKLNTIKKYFIIISRKILIEIWSRIPESIKINIRILLGKQFYSRFKEKKSEI